MTATAGQHEHGPAWGLSAEAYHIGSCSPRGACRRNKHQFAPRPVRAAGPDRRRRCPPHRCPRPGARPAPKNVSCPDSGEVQIVITRSASATIQHGCTAALSACHPGCRTQARPLQSPVPASNTSGTLWHPHVGPAGRSQRPKSTALPNRTANRNAPSML